MSITTTLAACSTTVSSNGPDGSVDAPSTLDDAIRYALSFIATLRDTRATLASPTFTGTVDLTGASVKSPAFGDGTSSIGFRNRIINGDFKVNQRGTSTFVNGGNTYGPDRWFVGITGASLTGGIVTAMTTWEQLPSFFQLNGTAGNTLALLAQRIESLNSRDLANQNATVSYWFYQSTGVTVSLQTGLIYANSTDNFGTTTVIPPPPATSVPSGVWTKIIHTFAVPAAATTGLQVITGLNSGLGAGAVMLVGQVQIEAGSVATPFERVNYGMQIVQCQRYAQKISLSSFRGYNVSAGNSLSSQIAFHQPMHTSPALTLLTTPSTLANITGGSFSFTDITTDFVSFTFIGTAAGQSFYSGDGVILALAEL